METENNVTTARPDYKSEIAAIVKSNLTPKLMRERLLDYHENDIAASLAVLQKDERRRLYSILDIATLSDVFEYAEELDVYLGELNIRKRVEILSRIEVSTAAAYLEGLEKKDRDTVIELMAEETRREIILLASFDKDEIGSKMTTNYISVRSGLDVREAMNELIAQAAENDNVSTIYVVDTDDTFVGAIDLKDLIRARSGRPLDDIIMTSYPYVYANEPIEDCIERIRGYSEDSFPVLDRDNRLTGVLTAQDIGQLIEDEIGDDYAKLGGLIAEEELKEPLKQSIGKRLPWLIVLFGFGLIVSAVVGVFDKVVSSLTLIVSFQSLILGMAGNVGTQSLAVTIRSLTDENLSGKQKLYLIFKEARVGLCNGLILGALSFCLIGLYLFLLKGEPATLAFAVSMCTGIALTVSMLLSGIAGTAIPIIFKKIKIDPAVASGPFITTVNDLVAVVTYYGLAWILLINTLGL
ncbi:MAG: magnesium transporter [Clostridia bacterium]|nr:magnesium transporter [Clostridia bacterium]